MPKTALTRELLFRLGDTLRQHCHKTEDGFATYDDPWTDDLIVKHVGSGVTRSHVQRLRVELIGRFAPTTNILNQYQLKDYLLELTKRVDYLQAKCEALETWAAARKMAPYHFGEG